MVLVARNAGENDNLRALVRAGAAMPASHDDYAETAAEMVSKMDTDKMSKAGRALVDGLGCQRVADAIEAL